MRQGDALTPETHSVLSRYSHFALGKDGPLCQCIWHGAQGKAGSLDTAGTEKLWALTFPVLSGLPDKHLLTLSPLLLESPEEQQQLLSFPEKGTVYS